MHENSCGGGKSGATGTPNSSVRLPPVIVPICGSKEQKAPLSYACDMSELTLSDNSSKPGIAGYAALGCGVVAIVVALVDATSPALQQLAVAPSLIAVGMGALALGLREMSVREQFGAQARGNAAARRELEEKMHWLKTTEAYAKIGHWRLDLNSDDVFWSDTTYAIHGLEPGTPPSLDQALDYYHEEDRDIVVTSIDRARLSGEFESFKVRLINAQGNMRNVEAGASVEFAVDGTPVALLGIFKDRTAEEEMQHELREASADAHALARAKGLFLARMSHEIRTPMNGLLGFAEMLAQSELNPQQQQHANYIVESGHSLQALLKEILDFTKVEAGKVEVKPVRTSSADLIANALQSVQPEAQRKRIRLSENIAADAPAYFTADTLRLRQILVNLLSNAVRYTDQGMVSLSLRRADGALIFEVSDTGTGISPKMLERIFDPFMQEGDHSKTERGGTGLGLAISRNLAQVLGGSLEVSSVVDEGSTFTLTIPLVRANAPPISAKEEISTPALPPKAEVRPDATPKSGSPDQLRVLVAEDFDINRELVTQMLARLGITIECAEDGLEAVSMVHQARAIGRPYHLVLMDLQMPRLDGFGATKRLRAAGLTEDDLPIIAVTANAFQDDIENCFAVGMQAHLAKPLSMNQLTQTLDQWLPGGLPKPNANAA